MEDDYELISKKQFLQLKEENAKLKSQLEIALAQQETFQKVDNSTLIEDIVQVLHEESKKERELIIENLLQIKDLNKSTLDNLLIKTEQFDERLKEMVDTVSGLVNTLSVLVRSLSEFKTQEINDGDIKDVLLEVRNRMSTGSSLFSDVDNNVLMTKLDEISIFLENLRVFLSYVKPANFVSEKSFL